MIIQKSDIREIDKYLKEHLTLERYEHTIGVSYTAANLNMRYDYDVKKAQLAGLLHDCAKQLGKEKMIQECKKYNIHITEVEAKCPSLLHAKVGAYQALHKFHVDDKEIFDAIYCHTTGKPDMRLLDKILYIADVIEPGRNKPTKLPEMRKLAYTDLDEALYCILGETLIYMENKKMEIDSMSYKAWEYYKKQRQEGVE